MKFDYFEDTLNLFRTTKHAVFDMFLVIVILGLVTIGLHILRDKQYIRDFHVTNILM